MPPYVYIENNKVVKQPIDKSGRKRQDYPYAHWINGAISEDFKHENVMPLLVDKTISFIKDQTKSEEPYFVYLPLPAPHNPILPLDKWKGKSGINPYADFVIMIDDLMGKIFEAVEEGGKAKNTLIVFTSDNGCAGTANFSVLEKAGHKPSYIYSGAKGSYLEEGHRVPFLAKWPSRIKANSICDETICTTDFMATCAALVDYELQGNEGEDSWNMLPLFDQKNNYKRDATIQHSKTGILAIRKGDWKLILSPNSGVNAAGKPVKTDSKKPEQILYNLDKDVAKKDNVAAQYPEKVKELKDLLI